MNRAKNNAERRHRRDYSKRRWLEGARLKEIASELGIHHSVVSRYLNHPKFP